METVKIKQIAADWVAFTRIVLSKNGIPSGEIRELFKRTYEVLYHYYKDALIPKEVSEMLLEMDGFFYFASLITSKEYNDDPELYQAAFSVAEALKEGFFDGNYKYAYPVLAVCDPVGNEQKIDLENGYIEELI